MLSPTIWQPKANLALEEEWFGEYYQPETSIWVRWFEKKNNERALALLRDLKPHARLLEVGVGTGSFLLAAQQRGFDVVGCDLSRAVATQASLKTGIGVHWGSLSELILSEDVFDAIVMRHVLEHVHNPVAFLAEAGQLLSPGGVLLISVPNVACWEAMLPGWNSYEPYHLVYFTPTTLRRTVCQAGLEITGESTHESFSGWFLAVLRTVFRRYPRAQITALYVKRSRQASRKQRPIIAEHIYRAAMVLIGVVSWPLRRIQQALGCGDEAICRSKRPVDV